ncbi:MAG: hypothetical protein FVQ82_13025 [Planctomycetes bacterium]|nr:hypothetical protein [Planctomycetota bacterium]
MGRDVNQAVARADAAATNEKLKSPAAIQKTKAVRHASQLGQARRAKVTEDAGIGSTITANLYHATTGVEQTTGDEAGITVYCNISGGTALNEASRLLGNGDGIEVKLFPYDNAGTVEYRWYCPEGFDVVTEECECVPI